MHTGDFRLDPHPIDGQTPDYARFTELGEQGVLVLCSDSTNVDRPGHTPSESEVGPALAPRFAAATGRIILATFASHIHRIQQVLELAARVGRKAALLGMSMEKNVRIAAELGYLQVPAGVLLPLEEVAALPARRQVILSTGSQGEPNSALALLAAGEHKHVRIERGDLVVISARKIPGNERTVGRVINALFRTEHPTHLSIPEALDVSRQVGAHRTFLTHLTHDNFHADLEAELLPRGITPAFDGLTVRIE